MFRKTLVQNSILNLGCPNFYSVGLFCCALQNLVVLYTLGDFGLSGESENRLQDCFSDTYPFPLSDCWIIHNVPASFFKVPASCLSILQLLFWSFSVYDPLKPKIYFLKHQNYWLLSVRSFVYSFSLTIILLV